MFRTLALASSLLLLPAAAAAQDTFVAPLPEDTQLLVTRDLEYATSGGRSLRFDLYRPINAAGPLPVAVMLNGVAADWMRQHVQYTGWGRYVTTSGFAGVTMDATAATADFDRLIAHLRSNASSLGLDPSRVVVWACSANVRAGLPLVSDPARSYIAGAVLYYGTGEAAQLRGDLPILIVRAGVDNPGLNQGIDAIVAKAAAANAPLSLINYAAGRHGFDIRDHNDLTRAIMSRTLAFMADAVNPGVARALRSGVTLAEASAALARSDWAAAIAAYEGLVKARPGDAEFAQRLAEAYVGKGETDKAVQSFERALQLGSPNRGIVTFALVRAHTKLNQIDKAIEWLQKLQPFLRFFRQRLLDDADLAPLRADARFKSIIG